MQTKLGPFSIDCGESGICVVTFSRPPVNAISLAVYEELGRLVDFLETNPTVRVVVLTALDSARAWCGGADLRDFVGMDSGRRKERYAFINAQVPRFYRMKKPVIAAINGSAIGVGMILAGLCDMRVASEDANFAMPEIDYGLVGGGAGLLSMLKMPEAKAREILYTGRKFSARELEATGFFNYVVPKSEVLAKSLDIAQIIASKSLPSLRARKLAQTALEGRTWMEAYLDAQALSSELVTGEDSQEGVSAFLEHRTPSYREQ